MNIESVRICVHLWLLLKNKANLLEEDEIREIRVIRGLKKQTQFSSMNYEQFAKQTQS